MYTHEDATTASVHNYKNSQKLGYNYTDFLVTVSPYSGTSDIGLPLLQTPPQCGQEVQSAIILYSLLYIVTFV